MKEMNLRDKIGQMIMTGFPSSDITPELINLIEEYRVANIILFSHNVSTIEQIGRQCRELHSRIEASTGHPAFIAVDQEGGVVTRLPVEACNVPGAMLIGATGKEEYAYQAGCITGAELRAIGVNMDLAPVLDINSNPDNPVIGTRSYSSEESAVERFGCNMMKGLQAAGVMPTVKHFPGHGDTSVDSHLGLPSVVKGLSELMSMELIPFQSAINQGVPCVMTSHILFPKIEKNPVPATMSKAILTDLLRDKMGFQGIIITDCLEMGAIRNNYGTAVGAVEAVKAGAQLLCISHTPSLVIDSIKRIEEAVLSGEIPMKLIDEAVEAILKYKKEYRIDNDSTLNTVKDRITFEKMIEQMTLEGITKVSTQELPKVDDQTVILGSYAYRSTLVTSPVNKSVHFAEYLSDKLHCSYLDVPMNPSEEEIEYIIKKIDPFASVIYGLYNGHLNRGQLVLANKIAESGKVFTAITLRNPYDLAFLDNGAHKLAAYEYNTKVFNALLRILNKEVSAVGTLPVRLMDRTL